MPIHMIPSVKDEPICTMKLLHVVECQWRQPSGSIVLERHLAGFDVNFLEGRISSPIRKETVDDKGQRTFETHSGRKYTILRERISRFEAGDVIYIQRNWETINANGLDSIEVIPDFIPDTYFDASLVPTGEKCDGNV